MERLMMDKVVWEGPQLVNSSLALVNRYLCLELIRRGVPVSIMPTQLDTIPDDWFAGADLLKSHYNADCNRNCIHIRQQWPPVLKPSSAHIQILFQPWEYGPIPVDWVQYIGNHVQEVWVNSEFTKMGYVKSGIPEKKIFSFPLGVDPGIFAMDGSTYQLKTEKKFKFLFVGGTIFRKGIDKVLEAYTAAFTPADDVCLVVKDFGASSFYAGQTYHEKVLECALDSKLPEVLYIDDELTPYEMAALYRACDCLVHPYRGEGFGLPILEAMACGIPPVIPDLGPAIEFTTPQCSYRVKSTVLTLPNSANLQTGLPAEIIDTDVPSLVSTMKRIVDNAEMHRTVSREAALHAKRFTWSAVGDIVYEHLLTLTAKVTRAPKGFSQHRSFRDLAKDSILALEQKCQDQSVSRDMYVPVLLKALQPNARVLDVGLEHDLWAQAAQEHGASLVRIDACKLVSLIDGADQIGGHELFTEKFDVVCLRNVIEHFQPETCLAVLMALLSQLTYRGRILIVTANYENSLVMSERFWSQPMNVRPYTPNLTQSLLLEAGFRTVAAGKMPGAVDSLIFGSRLGGDNPFV
ncbi:glycosyl transferase group 1 [Alicyclobacillus hesperidum URH17-3-68]|uniref:glycosyltransferase n=1 Tax=Alicyclobacillus hesperidum TaxID=89784 RepID=UPI000281BB86|nr:glycosyltransferase [Alicyclobacillus hesperidum]EJY56120.1 glycosyl transferase group 1 [Alicyclobacillus hesperidum URH17-3-68]